MSGTIDAIGYKCINKNCSLKYITLWDKSGLDKISDKDLIKEVDKQNKKAKKNDIDKIKKIEEEK